MSKIIGIDLGTTNSCVAVLDDKGTPRTLAGADGERTIPSWVSWSQTGQITVGTRARRQAVTNASGTIYGAKRLIGRKVNAEDETPDILGPVETKLEIYAAIQLAVANHIVVIEPAGYPVQAEAIFRARKDGSTVATMSFRPDDAGGWLEGEARSCPDEGGSSESH